MHLKREQPAGVSFLGKLIKGLRVIFSPYVRLSKARASFRDKPVSFYNMILMSFLSDMFCILSIRLNRNMYFLRCRDDLVGSVFSFFPNSVIYFSPLIRLIDHLIPYDTFYITTTTHQDCDYNYHFY